MKKIALTLCLTILTMGASFGQTTDSRTEQQLIELSKTKWQWMADRNADALDNLFHENAMFVHMGVTMNKEQELGTIRGGGILYKHAEIHDTSVRMVGGSTAIVLDRITLTAVVGGNEVVNPFMCTEVYVLLDGEWKLGSLSFTRQMGPGDRQ